MSLSALADALRALPALPIHRNRSGSNENKLQPDVFVGSAPLSVSGCVHDAALDPDARPRPTRSWVSEDKDPGLNPDLKSNVGARLALARGRPALRRAASTPRSGLAAQERRALLGLSETDGPDARSYDFSSPPSRVNVYQNDPHTRLDTWKIQSRWIADQEVLCKQAVQRNEEDARTTTPTRIHKIDARIDWIDHAIAQLEQSLPFKSELKDELKDEHTGAAIPSSAFESTPELRSESVAIADWPLVASAKALWQAKATEAPHLTPPQRSYCWQAPQRVAAQRMKRVAPQRVSTQPGGPPVPLRRRSVSFSRVESYYYDKDAAPNELGHRFEERIEDSSLATGAGGDTGVVELAAPMSPILKMNSDDPPSPSSVMDNCIDDDLPSTGRSSTSTTSPRLCPSREAAAREWQARGEVVETAATPMSEIRHRFEATARDSPGAPCLTERARRCVPPCPTELPPVPPPYRLTQTLSPQPPVAHALRAMPDVCSPTLEQPDAPAPQELEHAVAMPLPGNEVHHSTQAPLPPMLLIEARWPGPNPFASATPRPPLFMRRPAALLVILLMLLGARCALRPVAVILSVASPPESPFMPKDGGMGVDPARERAKALESAVLECAASMSKEQDALFHALQVERAALQVEREEFRKHLALLKAAPTQKHRVPPAEALGTPPPLPPQTNGAARAHKAVHWLGAALAKMKVNSKLRAAARSVQALTHRWTIAAAGWNFVG